MYRFIFSMVSNFLEQHKSGAQKSKIYHDLLHIQYLYYKPFCVQKSPCSEQY